MKQKNQTLTLCFLLYRLNSSEGWLADAVGNYTVDSKCTWLIEAPSADSNIRLHLKEFATECGWDHLYIFDGDSVFSDVVGVLSGMLFFFTNIFRMTHIWSIFNYLATSGVQFSCPWGIKSCEKADWSTLCRLKYQTPSERICYRTRLGSFVYFWWGFSFQRCRGRSFRHVIFLYKYIRNDTHGQFSIDMILANLTTSGIQFSCPWGIESIFSMGIQVSAMYGNSYRHVFIIFVYFSTHVPIANLATYGVQFSHPCGMGGCANRSCLEW